MTHCPTGPYTADSTSFRREWRATSPSSTFRGIYQSYQQSLSSRDSPVVADKVLSRRPSGDAVSPPSPPASNAR